MNSKQQNSYTWLFWMLATCGLILDLGSKYIIFGALYNKGQGAHYTLIPHAFRLTAAYTSQKDPGGVFSPLRTISGENLPMVNQGALFGMGQGNNHIFTIISLLASVAIIYWSTRSSTSKDLFLCMSLGLILAGTLGNLYDRIIFGGVRDFLHWYGGFDWPVFNIADSCLVCGASLLLIQAVFFAKNEAKPEHSVPEKSSEQLTPATESTESVG